ncbi:M56 family metallopeptidase [Mangrovibacterium lignilyticum]|uniref:M56 family metallopeptidase n=1 Tax=Mangrovibacterium lignilyticum TaxID=2668052 RepID=UPI0013D07207|nr:M56 family metallopeptidase [Mangrovibacterium lignilyticum]
METIIPFLLRVCIGSALFYAFYALLLRKTTFFRLNRVYLLAAVLLPLVFALFPYRYSVLVEGATPLQTEDWSELFRQTTPIAKDQLLPTETAFNWSSILLAIYCTGLFLLALRLLIQSIKPIRLILTNKKGRTGSYPIVENRHFPVPFSFFNHIFIHPEYHQQEDLDVILTHEEVHIRERHWIDLLVIELFTLVFWFNPISWLLEQAIKQNHEYLADQGVLSRGQSPARYQLLLVNQLMGMQVLGLSNNLNFALGPTRLNMMKKQKTSRKQLLRFALILPIVAGLLFAFAQPKYQTTESPQVQSTPDISTAMTSEKETVITGIVLDEKGEPLPGTSIVMKGTSLGTVADMEGKFTLKVPSNTEFALVASFVGYKTEENEMTIDEKEKSFNLKFVMERTVTAISTEYHEGDVPPPPPPPVPDEMNTKDGEPVFIIVEDMPHYPDGHYALAKYIAEKKKEMKNQNFFEGKNLNGEATVGFTVPANGKVTNVKILKSSGSELTDDAALLIVNGMEDWTPGKQRGKAVPVDYAVRIEF